MKNRYLRHLTCILLLVSLFANSCHGQVSTHSPNSTANASKPAPEIVGTPPPPVAQPGLFNDTGLISQYIRTIFQDSKGNFWFGPAGQSVARYDEYSGRLVSTKIFDETEEFEQLLKEFHIPYEEEKGTFTIYGYK